MTEIEEALKKARDWFKKARGYSVMTAKHVKRGALNGVRKLKSQRRVR